MSSLILHANDGLGCLGVVPFRVLLVLATTSALRRVALAHALPTAVALHIKLVRLTRCV